MKVFGYKNEVVNEYGLLEMSEITIQASPNTLRAIAKLLNESADLIEKNPEDFDHFHLQDDWKEWKEEYPDIIVAS